MFKQKDDDKIQTCQKNQKQIRKMIIFLFFIYFGKPSQHIKNVKMLILGALLMEQHVLNQLIVQLIKRQDVKEIRPVQVRKLQVIVIGMPITTGTITTHAGCYSQLKTCSSNGTKCVNLQTCDKYEVVDASCNAAKGTDLLPCFYEAASATNNNVASCRTKKCSDITDLTVCSSNGLSCVSDGTKCIAKAACSTYTAKAACNAGGTDGICVWKAGTTAGTGTCSKVTSCAAADQDACTTSFMKNYCYMKSTTTGTVTTSSCAPHTCASYQTYNGNQCASYKVYGGATQQICALDAKSVCTETDPTKLVSDTCFSSSNYVYTWNAAGNTCQQCKGSTVQPGNNSSTGNETNTTTDSGFILGFASIIFGYVLF